MIVIVIITNSSFFPRFFSFLKQCCK